MVAEKARGYAVTDAKNWKEFKLVDFDLKPFEEDDVTIDVIVCSICGSDVHTISSGWGDVTKMLPLVVGHEIVGTATKVGKNVQGIKVGDRVGVGAQVGSCYKCKCCKDDNENYCAKGVSTYADKHPDGTQAQGGYSNKISCHQQFVFPIPKEISNEDAASMFCAGLTVFSPMIRNLGLTEEQVLNKGAKGKKIGVIGLGGLGHYAVLFGVAMGAEVVVFSHSSSKEEDAKKMGASYVLTSKDDFAKSYQMEFDVIICTQSVSDSEPLSKYLSMVNVGKALVHVGMPEKGLGSLQSQSLAYNAAHLAGSHIGSKKEVLIMLKLAVAAKIKPWINVIPMSRVKEGIEAVLDGSVRYRTVLVNDIDKQKD